MREYALVYLCKQKKAHVVFSCQEINLPVTKSGNFGRRTLPLKKIKPQKAMSKAAVIIDRYFVINFGDFDLSELGFIYSYYIIIYFYFLL
jgi:hypothetical protein